MERSDIFLKIKTRKEREKEYKSRYGNISNDKFERLKDSLGEKFNIELLESALDRVNYVKNKIVYNKIHIIFYEEPIQSHRPRTKGKHAMGMYVPNAKANHDAIEKFINDLKESISIIATPMQIVLKAYYPMPKNIKPIEVILYETEHDYAIGKPDFDNVLKAYCDMLLTNIILDDDIVSSCRFDKYFSLKPRVELEIIYTNGYSSEYTYKTIKSRKTFKRLKDKINVRLLVAPYKNRKHIKGEKK